MILSVGIDALFILIGTLHLKKTLFRALQSLKQVTPKEVTDEGIIIEAKLVHPEKQLLFIEVTEIGIVIDVKLLHPENEANSSEFIDEGSDMDFKLVHNWKQLSPIEVTEGGIVMEVKLLQLLKQLFPIV